MQPTETWGVIPARGGSKSIPYKNLHLLAGRPLLDYVFHAGRASGLSRVLCSTEDRRIAHHCAELGLEVHHRPTELAGDASSVVDTLIHLLHDMKSRGETLPRAVALLQPTSPFLLPEHIRSCIDLFLNTPGARSVQTVAKPPHNHHAYNQRVVENGRVRFRFARQRALCYNKQRKPAFHVFGNLVITRSGALLSGKGVFAGPSLALEIPAAYATDVDAPDDFELAEYLLERGRVSLPHLPQIQDGN